MNMELTGILNDKSQASKILHLTCDTLLLFKNDGTCVDMIVKTENNPYVNDKFTLLGKRLYDVFPQETLNDLIPNFENVVKTGEPSNANYNLPGNEKMYYFKCIIQKFDEEHLLCQYRDITRRSQMKINLQKANDRANETERTAKIGYWIYNTETDIFKYSGYVDILIKDGETIESRLTDYLHSYVHPEDRDILKSLITNCESDNFSDFRLITPNKIYFLRGKKVKTYEQNGVRMIEGYTQNINDIIEKWDELEMITQAINKSNDSIYATDMEGNMVFANQLCRKRNHIPTNENISKYKAYDVLRFMDGKLSWDEFIVHLKESNNYLKFISNFKFPDYNITNSDCTSYVVRNKYGKDLIWNFRRDITERVQYEQKLKKAKEKAEESDRLKSAFLSNMSHEIRTPLNAIVGFSGVLAETENKEERKKYFEIIESNNNRLLLLIKDILDLSKIESGIIEFTYSPVSLNDLCQEVFVIHQFNVNDVHLVFAKPDTDLRIETDKNRIIQVLSNLIGNAIKFTKQGSITYGYYIRDNFVEFYVTDTGIGIAPNELDKVFERFIKLNDFAPGTGLGLSISKTIVERLGGNISVISEVGVGSEFSFRIPAKIVNAQTQIRSTFSQPNHKKIKEATILVAEDNPSNYELVNAMIGTHFRLINAKNGEEAVNLFQEIHPDLILMDLKMPVINGLESTYIIRQLDSEIPIIAVSAHAYEEDQNEAYQTGCNDFLIKPLNKEILLKTINKYIG